MQTIKKETKVPVSLNKIIEFMLDNMEETMPEAVKESNRMVETELSSYTKKVMEHYWETDTDTITPEKVAETVETDACSLLDSICASNSQYLAHGVKIGAHLLWQLLES